MGKKSSGFSEYAMSLTKLCGTKKEYRGREYAVKGLALTIEEAKKIIKEDEIYMSVNIDNPASLAVMLKNGAYIHHSDEKEHYTRIKL